LVSGGFGVLLLAGGLVRIVCEEHLIKQSYPEYLEYSKATKRMIPYMF
jgi:protein-S-isoprenylcysteine O-methyltransferase Ste14